MTPLPALVPLFDDDDVSEIMVNGPGPVWVERAGRVERTAVVLDRGELSLLVERVLGPLGRRVDRSSPYADGRLDDGSRVNVIIPPLALDGPCVTIRRFRARPVGLDEFGGPGVVALLRWAVAARANVVVSGSTGAGKTTLLAALVAEVPGTERIITIEDAAELAFGPRHVVRLESRPPNAEGVGGVTIRELVRNALRMRPDRLVVGEVRGAEALDMVQALNTGHDGSLSTCHANGPRDALNRLETMVLAAGGGVPADAVRRQLLGAIDLVVHLVRGADGHRLVAAVAEVVGGPAGEEARARLLTERGALVSLPSRRPRSGGAARPEPRWLGS